jgi:hypothetical protein
MTDNDFQPPYGWTAPSPDEVTYSFGEAKFGTGPNDIPANPTGSAGGEDEYHSESVPADSDRGPAKVTGGEKSSYGGTDGYQPERDSKDPGDTGVIDLPVGHIVTEDGIVQGRKYYVVQDIKSEKYYGVVPNFKEGEQYKSGMKPDRTSAVGDVFRVLSASLPDSALAQLRERYPETPALSNVYD